MLRQTLEVFDERGRLTALTARQAEIDAIVTLMDTLDDVPLHQTLVSFTSGIEGYWGYYQRAEQVYQACMARYPRDIVQALACGWQLARQATNRKAYGMRKRLAQDAEFSFCSAATLHPDAAQALRKEVLDALDTERQEFIADRECQLSFTTAAGDVPGPGRSAALGPFRVCA